tara:strand:- start:680 stop:910 length:231 start_codon:yes stop_codon:yes gene_type:complete
VYGSQRTSCADLHEVALWSDFLTVDGQGLYYSYLVDNQAIKAVIPKLTSADKHIDSLLQLRETAIKRFAFWRVSLA